MATPCVFRDESGRWSGVRVALLQERCIRCQEHCESWTSLIDQGLYDDLRHSDPLYIECVGSAGREVEDAPASVWVPDR